VIARYLTVQSALGGHVAARGKPPGRPDVTACNNHTENEVFHFFRKVCFFSTLLVS